MWQAARRRGPRASRVEALQRQQQNARQQGPEGSGTAGPSGSHVLGGGSPDRGQHPVQIGGFLSSLGAHGLSPAPVQGSHQHQQHQQHSHHPQAPSGHEPQQQPNQLSPFGSASLQQPIAPSHTAGALPAPDIPAPIPGQQDWSTWAGFPDSTVSQSDSRTLPFIVSGTRSYHQSAALTCRIGQEIALWTSLVLSVTGSLMVSDLDSVVDTGLTIRLAQYLSASSSGFSADDHL